MNVRGLPVLTGALTVVLLGAAGYVVWSSGSVLWGAVLLGFAAFRLVLLAIQLARRLRAAGDDEGPTDRGPGPSMRDVGEVPPDEPRR